MTDSGNTESLLRRAISLILSALIVLGLVLSDVEIGAPVAVGAGDAQIAEPGGASAAASKRARNRAKPKRDQRKGHQRRDKQGQKKKEHHKKDRKRAGKQEAGKRTTGTRQNGKQASQQPREIKSGRLPAAETMAAPAGAPLSARDRYIVVLDDTATDALNVANDLAIGGTGIAPTHVYRHVFQGFAAVIPDEALEAVKRNPQVKEVIPDEVVYGTAQIVPTGINRIDADVNPAAKIDGNDERVDVDVAVLDTAGLADHPDINEWAWANCTDSPINSDDQGHGTHVGGTIGALDNGIGVVGVAPGARLWNFRVLTADPEGGSSGLQSWILCGLDLARQYAIPQPDGLGDIEVVNASLGRTGTDSNCQTQVDAYHWAYCRLKAAGITVVVAAMNEARDAANVVPATYEEVITVSALADSDGRPGGLGPATSAGADDTLATFSNFGADVDIAAPGVDILSTVPTGPCELCHPSGYELLNGTSMAAPHVAGAAALYLAAHPGASPDEVKAHLLNTRERIALPGDPDGIAEGILYVGGGAAPSPLTASPSGDAKTSKDKKKGKKHKKGKKGKKHKKGKGRKR